MANTSYGGVFEAAGFQFCDPPILQPADVFLDRSGDAIRRRLFMVRDAVGGEYCLRPEFTIPVCRMLLTDGKMEGRRWYEGPIFRVPRPGASDPNELVQAGIELIGDGEELKTDAEVFALVYECVKSAGVAAPQVTTGDLGLFTSVLGAVDLPGLWRDRLIKHFWHADVFAELLARISGETPEVTGEAAQLMSFIRHLDRDAAKAAVRDMLAAKNVKPIGGRSIDEIATRFLEKAEDAASDIAAPDVVRAIHAFLSLNVSLDEAADAVKKTAGPFGLALDDAAEVIARRADALKAVDPAVGRAAFAPAFGRELEYYSGFVFELHAGGIKLAGGGRYDGLMAQLGAADDVPAVGGALWVERIAKAARKEAAS